MTTPWEKVPLITTVAEYSNQSVVAVSATQLPLEFTRTRATHIVKEWTEFFSSPSPITELHFTTRTPKRLFAALAGQTQLRELHVKWGDYEDLSVLASMRELHTLVLRGAVRVHDVEPLDALPHLETLELEGLRDLHDASAL